MTGSTPQIRQNDLLEQLAILPDSQERLSWLIQRSIRLPALPESAQTDANLVPGCVSRVWLLRQFEDGRCRFQCQADSPLVQALVAVVCQVFDSASPAEIADFKFSLLHDSGILRNLSPTRQNGLGAVENAIRAFAADSAG